MLGYDFYVFDELGGVGIVIIGVCFEQVGGDYDVIGLFLVFIGYYVDIQFGCIFFGDDFEFFEFVQGIGQLFIVYVFVVGFDEGIGWCWVFQVVFLVFCSCFDEVLYQVRFGGDGFLQCDDGGVIGWIVFVGEEEEFVFYVGFVGLEQFG